MQVAMRILANTSVWVWALLAYLIWQGWQAFSPSAKPIWRTLIVPLVFFLMGLSRLWLARGAGVEPLLAGHAAAVVLASLAFTHGPRLLAVDRKNHRVTP